MLEIERLTLCGVRDAEDVESDNGIFRGEVSKRGQDPPTDL